MSRDEHSGPSAVETLFEGWVEHHVLHGERLNPRELCRGRPELLEPLRAQIAKYERLGRLIDPPTELEPGTALLHYRIVEKLGAGGMGEVYVAHDTKLGRRVALKILPSEMAEAAQRLERFRREARIVAALNHPNIVTLHSIDEDGGVHFLTMELVEGETLEALTSRHGLEPDRIVEIAGQLVDALAAAHEKGVIHRDLKPANVIVSAEGRAKVLDFGLAKLQWPEAAPSGGSAQLVATRVGQVLGTVAYMSPEQARGESLDGRADLFSLGVILYELATGKRPFPGDSVAEVLGHLQEREPIPPSQINSDVSPKLERVILKCLEKPLERRYQSARELGADLVRLEVRSSRRWPVSAAVVVAVAGALVVATEIARSPPENPGPIAGRTTVTAPDQAPASLAVLPFVEVSAETEREYLSEGVAAELLDLLARNPGLRVAGQASSFQFEGKDQDLRIVGERLGVANLLKGSIGLDGDLLRLSVHLVKSDGSPLWAASYERDLEDLFAVQMEIARSVSEVLDARFERENGANSDPGGGNAQAYEAYLQGRYWAEKGGRLAWQRAIDYFQKALAEDPGYAWAWVGLASVYHAMTGQGLLPFDEGSELAFETANRALELDDALAEGWSVLGLIAQTYGWDWPAAEEAFERALELEPRNPTVLTRASGLAAILGRFDQAITLALRAVEVDPLNPGAYRSLGRGYYVAGRQQEAESAFRKAQTINPEAHRMLGEVYLAQGRPAAALAEMELEKSPFYRTYGLALAYHALGRDAESQAALSMIIERASDTAAYQIAQIYAFRGENDQAFEWLERAWKNRDPGLPAMRVPLFQALHDDPRWAAFLGKMGLELGHYPV